MVVIIFIIELFYLNLKVNGIYKEMYKSNLRVIFLLHVKPHFYFDRLL